MRKILIIVAVVIVLLGAGGYVYWRYFTGGPGLVATQPTLPASSNATAPAGAGQSSVSITESAAALSVQKVSARLTKVAVGPIVPGEAVVPVYGASTGTSTAATSTTKKAGKPPAPVQTDTAVEFIERQSGNIFSYLLNAGTLTRTSNKTVPGIMRAAWSGDGATAFVTYLSSDNLSTVNTYGLAADGSGGFYLPTGLADVAASGGSILELASGANGSVATLAKTDGTKGTTAWSSPLAMLRVNFAGKGYVAFTKPSQSLDGYAFYVSPAGVFSQLFGPRPGLDALANHAGSKVFITSANGGVMQSVLLDTATGAADATPLATIADKCAWTADDATLYCGVPVNPSPSYSYPDDWYQGAVHFGDKIWKIDVKGHFAQLVFDPATVKGVGALDIEAPTLDPTGSYLVFINKNDGSLWSYRL